MAKIQISLGALSFSAEGEEKWLTDQFKFAIGQLDTLAKIAAPLSAADQKEETESTDTGDKPVGSLVAHLKDRNAEASQNRKFLATAD